ncbi:Polynucleotide kinase 3' phosphatase [Ceraceosorus bombacis]|uniref:Polynucleotide kinase 3' phosphatase n=1 Tax=Ceraceosorus bombacis TaxID=401625 RepID=A0A0P1BDH5_9BASI|nr:Polynucleotide kinase 3' phosphatase [Ceraceosorus bombacis]
MPLDNEAHSTSSATPRREQDDSSSSDNDQRIVLTSFKRAKPNPTPSSARVPQSDISGAKTSSSANKLPESLAPIFARKTQNLPQSRASYSSGGTMRLAWRSPLKHFNRPSCLVGAYGEPFSAAIARARALQSDTERRGSLKIAAFDLDGTLVTPKQGTWPSATDEFDYKFVFPSVCKKVKAEHDAGAVIVVISNQKQTGGKFDPAAPPKKVVTWQKKLGHIAEAIGAPMLVFAALADDYYRKPALGMWEATLEELEACGGMRDWVCIEAGSTRSSFYVGDAAGRSKGKGREADHNDTDRKWALNAGLPFHTPEEWFLANKPESYELSGWRPSQEHLAEVSDNAPPFYDDGKLELVFFVGPPASGKTSYYRRHFAPRGYVHVNQDTLKTRDKCIKAAEAALQKGQSVVIDNTNPKRATREEYKKISLYASARVRMILFDLPRDHLEHNNLVRAHAMPDEKRERIPAIAFNSYFKNLEKPHESEGEIHHAQWAFVGDEEAKRKYQMWYT